MITVAKCVIVCNNTKFAVSKFTRHSVEHNQIVGLSPVSFVLGALCFQRAFSRDSNARCLR